jgi:hypothetical protein
MISCLFYKSEVGFVGGLNLRIKIDINRNQILLYVTSLIYAWTGPELFQPARPDHLFKIFQPLTLLTRLIKC